MSLDILIVDDEEDIRQLTSDILCDEGYSARTAANSAEAFDAIAERLPSAIILDIWLQGSDLDGLGILEILQEKYPTLPVIIMSGHGNIETAVSAIRLGAYDYLEKPFKEEKLLLIIKRALETTKLQSENKELKSRNQHEEIELIGRSPAITQLRTAIERIAPTESRILIHGANGVGKAVVARQIHQQSRRKKNNFIVLNTSGLTPKELEIELFGTESKQPHAEPTQAGAFERANGGTLLIDEVAHIPLAIQGKILRALQEQKINRLGSEREVKTDVRVITASSHDLQQLIQEKKFREDLYYRLNVVSVEIPSLSERREDIAPMCEAFLKHLARTASLPQRTLGEDTIATMQAYNWPGNVRQLRNVIEWLLIMAPSEPNGLISANMLPMEIIATSPAGGTNEINTDIMSKPLREARELFEVQYLTAQINRFSGNISRTSNFIGMERSALHRKLKNLNITNDEPISA